MLTLADIIECFTGNRPVRITQQIRRVVIDSREAGPGDLFVALKGERTDGHLFIKDAFVRGAVATLVEQDAPMECDWIDLRPGARPITDLSLPVCLRVNNVLTALQDLAGYWRSKFRVRVIGITGSVGKTSTKELTWAVLSRGSRGGVLRSEGNLNNEIGVPLTLLQLESTHKHIVLEMGMYARGEIARLCKLAKPAVGVVTNVGPVHLERLGNLEAIAAAKAELIEALPPAGVAILNYDETLVREMAAKSKARVFFYGLDERADLWADEIESEGIEGVSFTMHYKKERLHVHVPLLGRHSVHTALRAAAVGLAEGMSWDDILSGLQDQQAQIRLVAVPGPQGSTILDDTYNASPTSTIAALNLLAELDGRKIAVLGDMLELGSYEEEGHRLVGRRAMDVADILITVGKLGRIIGEEALSQGMPPDRVCICEDNAAAVECLQGQIEPNDFILIKGSRGMKMEDLVAVLGKG
jgi:UDP-N-acetylmuramoyl-tripeptide--D-alanyl-D-alanine ligase